MGSPALRALTLCSIALLRSMLPVLRARKNWFEVPVLVNEDNVSDGEVGRDGMLACHFRPFALVQPFSSPWCSPAV